MRLRSECDCECHAERPGVRHISRCCRMDPPDEAQVREALESLDGSTASAISLLTGIPISELGAYGGTPEGAP